jgi:hypothetical protein
MAALLAIAWAGSASAGAIVVRSSGPSAKSYPPGKALADDARITLRANDQLVILDGRGTRTVKGPGTFSASAASTRTGATATARRILSTQGSAERRGGAVRGTGETPVAIRSPNLWFVDAGRSATMCVADPAAVKLWRADASDAATLTLSGAAGSATVRMEKGVSVADWPGALPVTDRGEYRIAGGAAEPSTVRLVLMGPNPEGLENTASALIQKGCDAQLDLLVDTFALPDQASGS